MATHYGDNIIERNGWFSLLYTVPTEYVNRRGGKRQIVKSLRTRDREKAKRLAIIAKAEYMMQYETEDFEDYKDIVIDVAKATAERFGFTYGDPKKLFEESTKDFVEASSAYVEARENTPRPNRAEVATFSAAVEVPGLLMSTVFPRFKQLSPEKTKMKNAVDARIYWQRYERYARDFVEQMGDLDVLKMTTTTVDEYRDTLVRRVMDDEFKSEYANKGMRYIRLMLKVVLKRDHPGVLNPFREFDTIDVDDSNVRVAFTEDEVRLIRESLDTSKLPDEAKAIIMIAQNTGIGIKELCQMAPDDVVLSGDIPHLKIRKGIYRNYLKTKDRERDIALIGESLSWMKRFPRGFEKYTDPLGPGRMYRSIQKFMKATVPGKSYTSYRHRIAYLMRNSPFKDQFQNAVMGHATPGQTGHYGGPVWLSNTHMTLMEVLPEDNR